MAMKRETVAVTLVVSGFILICACSPEGHAGCGTIAAQNTDRLPHKDLVGRTVWISKGVERIVLPRSKDIYLLASLLGDALPDKLIAWGPDLLKDDTELYGRLLQRFPRLGQIPLTGSVYGDALNPEQIVALRPDLVVLDKFMLDHGYKYIERLEAAGLPIIFLDGSNDPLAGPQKGVGLLGEILGVSERAQAVVRFVDDQLSRVVSHIGASTETPPSVYLEQGYLGPSAYADTYGGTDPLVGRTSWGVILHALKVRNIADGIVARQAPIHPEYLFRADPDIIVITGQNWSNPGSMRLGCNVRAEDARRCLAGFLGRPGWDQISAVKNKRVYGVFHNTSAITVFAGIQALAKYCYPGLFEDLYPEENLREFHERFLPIGLGGTWSCAVR